MDTREKQFERARALVHLRESGPGRVLLEVLQERSQELTREFLVDGDPNDIGKVGESLGRIRELNLLLAQLTAGLKETE